MNGVTAETTNYYYNGSVLMAMQAGNTVQRFSYDAQGKVVSVNYNGTEYYYLRNAQGDGAVAQASKLRASTSFFGKILYLTDFF